ncbi:MAG: N-acetylmuramic acid 6-phosphate etherase [Lentisphaerae bacterium GWF2_52_8]|nr:MAG: N-acetylmuramic acid 6-phosphate etherase [Lentisphaerae bacterium GWF2_52_8]
MANKLITESINPDTVGIDRKSVQEILKIMNDNDRMVPLAVEKTIPQITEAVETIVAALKKGGRLFYIGAGTSGRLGIVDASECPPTFGVPSDMVQALIAGGRGTVFKAKEGAEDNEKQGAIDLRKRGFKSGDVVVGLSTSGRTPYVCGALSMARNLGAPTISIICNPEGRVREFSDIVICPIVGPEVITGSTRLKAGTSEKLVLNMISTTVMIKLGRVDGNMMSHMQITCGKLKERAINTIMLKGNLERSAAEELLKKHDFKIDAALSVCAKASAKKSKQGRRKQC